MTGSGFVKGRFGFHQLCSVILDNMAKRRLMEEIKIICLFDTHGLYL